MENNKNEFIFFESNNFIVVNMKLENKNENFYFINVEINVNSIDLYENQFNYEYFKFNYNNEFNYKNCSEIFNLLNNKFSKKEFEFNIKRFFINIIFNEFNLIIPRKNLSITNYLLLNNLELTNEIKLLKEKNLELNNKINFLENINSQLNLKIIEIEKKLKQNNNNKNNNNNNNDNNNDNNSNKNEKNFLSGIIKNPSDKDLLFSWISPTKSINPVLLFSSKENGDNSKNFHKFCDGLSPTLILIRSKENKIFGGFTTTEWDSFSGYKKDSNAFLFSIDEKKMVKTNDEKYSIYCNIELGPVFGSGHDLYVSSEFLTNDYSFNNTGDTFQFNKKFFLNGGNKFFGINEMEVYHINYNN